jgi:hypothetical protein
MSTSFFAASSDGRVIVASEPSRRASGALYRSSRWSALRNRQSRQKAIFSVIFQFPFWQGPRLENGD